MALAIALGTASASSQTKPQLPVAPSPVSAEDSKESNSLIALARSLGAPPWLVSAGVVISAIFLLAEPVQKNLKVWREGWKKKPEPPSKDIAPTNPAAGSAGRDLVQRDQVQRDQYNAPANVTNAETVNNYYRASEPQRERILSTIAPPPQGVGVMGREEQLKDLERRMGEPGNNRRLVVHGEPGVGKSELLREYGRRQQSRYPGGRYWIDCRLNLAQEIASLGRQCWQMTWLEGPLEEQAMEVIQLIAKEKVLLLIDNATDEAQVEPFLPPAGQAHVLLSSTSRDWGPPLVEVWRPEGLQRLDPAAAMVVLTAVAGSAVAEQLGKTVIAELGGLPVHLLPTARTLARRARLGRLSEGELVPLSDKGMGSFSLAWEALDPAARLLLQAAGRWFNPNALVEAELVTALAQSFQGPAVVRDAVDACRDLYLLQGEGRLTMHQLLVRYVKSQPPQRLDGLNVENLSHVVSAAMGDAVMRFEKTPADRDAFVALQCYRLDWELWGDYSNVFTPPWLDHISGALFMLGEYAEASCWMEEAGKRIRSHPGSDHLAIGSNLFKLGGCMSRRRLWKEASDLYKQALAEMNLGNTLGELDHSGIGVILYNLSECALRLGNLEEAIDLSKQSVQELRNGDLNGQVDHLGIGRSLHQLGIYALKKKYWREASDWFLQAVEAKQQGNSRGCVDHESLGVSLHALGMCAYEQGQWPAAAGWYEQALAEKRQGDLHGRVNHESLGVGLHKLGNCAYQQGQWPEAAGWFEQAVAEKRQGDIFGCVNQSSVSISEARLFLCRKKMGLA